MASGKYQESSSSRFSRCKYQVFLSFRGEDTRKNFTDHLYTALVQARIRTFREDNEIRGGENIDLELQQAIQQSKIAIIVFSKNYASSRWCLDELVMIMERVRTGSCIVFPVFYDVDPSQVRKQTGSFAAAFVEHQKHFKEEMDRVNGWRIALKNVADLGGMDLGDGYEAQFVQSIVEKVSMKLDRKIFQVPLHFIGRDLLINCINSWLQNGSDGAAIVILYGIGGVGKTAIAKSVYNQNFYKFAGKSFLSNVRERSKESNGVVRLQRQLLSDILNKIVDEIHDVDEGIIKIEDALCCRRTFITLDDVDKREQFNAIVDMRNWLCQGSKIIVTTRNKSWITADDEFVEFKVKPLDNEKSLELFSWHTFGQAHPVEDFTDLSWRIVNHCNGLPLAHRVIGSSLSRKRRQVWESILQEMEVIPNCEVQKVLRISYDSLDDDYQKDLFLDIACFFNGMDEDYVSTILDGLGVGATYRVDNLIDRCLLERDQKKRLCMHQLIRDMGRQIARQESPKCQRIWHHTEAFTILKETIQDAEKLRGLTLDMHALMKDNCTEVVCTDSMVRHKYNLFQHCPLPPFLPSEWISEFFFREQVQAGQTSLFPIPSTDVFRKMQNVKFLQLNYMKFYGSYEHFPKNLIWLCWHGFSLRSIPKHFCLEKLVVLDLSKSSLVDAWKGKLSLPKLKILDLRYSRDLIRTPNFSGLPVLEKLILEGCVHLVQIHESIGDLHCLVILNLKNCKSLLELPEEISSLSSLQLLHLDGCSNLDGLNMGLDHHQGLRLLQSDGIVASTSYIESLLLKLFVPSRFSARKNSRFTSFPLPPSLVSLNLSDTPLRFLPENIKDLSTLRFLVLERCNMLQILPELPSNLVVLDVSYCYSLQGLVKQFLFTRARDCDQLVQFQDLIKLDLIQKADTHMFRIMEMVSIEMQPRLFKIQLRNNIFHVLIYNEGNEMLRFHEEGEEGLIQNEFGEHLSFEVSTPAAHRICGFNIFTWFSSTSELNIVTDPFSLVIKNNTKGRSVVFDCYGFLLDLWVEKGWLWISHCKCGVDDLGFDDGDEFSVSVLMDDPRVQIKRIGVRILHEEGGSKNDYNNIQSNNEATTSHSSSCSCSSDSKVITANSRSSFWDNRTLGDGYAAKAGMASQLFRHYFCFTRCNYDLLNVYACFFEKK
ncbi:PREDICTED: TMV resistance protein N-like isoform X3 [Populus euphratica]|nr:PREDICTED: TMV resistance protein N-like isoform X3 [Populus euphratica]